MASPTKSYAVVAALQELAANSVYTGTPIDMGAKLGGLLIIQFGRAVTTALTAGVQFRVEASGAASGNMAWHPIGQFQSAIATAIRLAVTTTSNSGQKELTLSTTTGYALRDRIFVENVTLLNSEFHRVVLVHAATHLTVEDNLANTQADTTSFVATAAESYGCPIEMGVARIRLVVDNSPNGVAIRFKADLSLVDTFA